MTMRARLGDLPGADGEVQIFLDGLPVDTPLECRSLNTIRSFLETILLKQQRGLNLSMTFNQPGPFHRVEAESVSLEDSEILLLKTALQQVGHIRVCVETTLTLVLIN